MLTVKPIQSKKEQEELCALCSCEYLEEALCYRADDGDFIGICQLLLKNGCGYIKNLRPRLGYSDFEAMFILGRATLNFIDLCGVHTCLATPDAGEERLMKAIGFRPTENNEYFVDMTGMFDGNCQGHK